MPKRIITFITDESSDSISFAEISSFIHQVLGDDFISSTPLSFLANECIFTAKEHTTVKLKNVGRNVEIEIKSDSIQIVNGLVEYLEEVFEHTFFDIKGIQE